MGIHQADAVIVLKNHLETRYPIGYLPLSMRQLKGILNTFTTDGRPLEAHRPRGPQHRPRRPGTTEEELADSSWTWYSTGTTAKNPQ